jgi:hypothetical protein
VKHLKLDLNCEHVSETDIEMPTSKTITLMSLYSLLYEKYRKKTLNEEPIPHNPRHSRRNARIRGNSDMDQPT